ncbi:DinB family protein [Chryseobacterium sp. MEBOG06]|uniref:DinB family protein n=1 Tax=unclassified Chryseobacterium TaxID=2593645 RepID=UPI001F3C310B|nr:MULTISPECIES: DinB family protein [unclassified Chryseobacterium]UKB82159.1 DinB family protein [Chryseobacterium sp. MEBOG06]
MKTKSNDIEFLKNQVAGTYKVVSMNIDGVSDEESMIFPNGEANCMNWIFGHLIYIRNAFLNILGEEAVWDSAQFSCYNRGEIPLNRKEEFVSFEELKSYFRQSQDKLEAKLEILESLNTEWIKDISNLSLHEIYHSGQLGYLRRLLGKPGAIK